MLQQPTMGYKMVTLVIGGLKLWLKKKKFAIYCTKPPFCLAKERKLPTGGKIDLQLTVLWNYVKTENMARTFKLFNVFGMSICKVSKN